MSNIPTQNQKGNIDITEYIKLTITIREKLGENYSKEMSQLFQYTQSLMGVLGLIAGFGFTAFQFIESYILFFVGELLVVGSVLYLVYKVKIYTAAQPIKTEEYLNKYHDKAREIKSAILSDDKDAISALSEEIKKEVNDTSEIPKLKIAKIISDSLKKSFWFSSVGIILIFASFVICL
ncbi:MAG: hypothetical protein RI935_346 [Candidatus Parcubacteria bacterium]|jgi:hypothetical protein